MTTDTATAVTYTAATFTVFSGVTLNEIGVVVGIIVGVAGLIANIYFKHKHLKIISKRHSGDGGFDGRG